MQQVTKKVARNNVCSDKGIINITQTKQSIKSIIIFQQQASILQALVKLLSVDFAFIFRNFSLFRSKGGRCINDTVMKHPGTSLSFFFF